MKITVFTDLHADQQALAVLKQKSANCDFMLCAGDISIFEQGLGEILTELDAFNKPIFIIPGNHEDEELLDMYVTKFKHITNVHLKTHNHNQLLILGHGGGGFSHRSQDFVQVQPVFADAISKHRKQNPDGKIALIVHQPPHGTSLDEHWESYTGNKDYSEFIKKYQPDIVICGHIHENQDKQDKIGKTLIINPGPLGKNIEL